MRCNFRNKDSCRRLGVFIFYDASGIVDKYIEVLLNSMSGLIQRLVIVVNGKIDRAGEQRLKKYSKDILIRENRGFDAGGYKDVFTKYLINEDLHNWDEIILFNDTFYGPLYPWEDIFKEMEEEKNDFWGLSRYPGGCRKSTGDKLLPHIQSYFIACKKSLFLTEDWCDFWDTLEYPETYWDAVMKFEIRFSYFFSEKGYRYSAFTDRSDVEIEYDRNPSLECFYELIRNAEFPILKKKVICLDQLDKAAKIFDYIKDHTEYDADLILSHTKRLCMEGRIRPIAPFEPVQLERFCNAYKRIFLYGHGKYGKGLARYFEYKGWKYEGFIVTECREKQDGVFVYGDLDLDSEDGVVLALGKEAFQEVYPMIRRKLDEERLCYPEYN